VFSDASLASYDHADVTNDHPSDMVTADSFKNVAVGHAAGSARRDGDFVVVDLLVKDKDAIDAVENGKAALSAGYTAEYSREPGQTEDGESYEYIQRDIKINHIALVDRARAGGQAKLFDDDPDSGDSPMGNKVTIDHDKGTTVEVGDEATQKLVQQTIDSLRQQASDAEQRASDAETKREEVQAAHDKLKEDNERLQQQASEEAIAERLKAVSDTREQARNMVGDQAISDTVDPMQIKRETLTTVRPSIDWSDKSDHYVQAAWDMETTQSDADRADRSHRQFGADYSGLHTQDGQPAEGTQAYHKFLRGETH